MLSRAFTAASVLLSLLVVAGDARAEFRRVEMKIAGMDWATCAHAVRVAVRKLEGVESVDVSLERGVADIRLRAGNRVTLPQLRQVVRNNGFNPRDAAVSVIGELGQEAASPVLTVAGIGAVLTIAEDSSRPDAYRRIRDQLATIPRPRVTVQGIVTEPQTKHGRDRLVVHALELDPKPSSLRRPTKASIWWTRRRHGSRWMDEGPALPADSSNGWVTARVGPSLTPTGSTASFRRLRFGLMVARENNQPDLPRWASFLYPQQVLRARTSFVMIRGRTMIRQAHWNRVYETKAPADVSWYQPEPTISLRLIETVGFTPSTWIIDVGGGDSRLVDRLLERDARCATVLDVSGAALERSKRRLGEAHTRVRWIEADVTSAWHVDPLDVWHDRAVFHFLTDPADRASYVARVRQAVKPAGVVIMATFAPDGPEWCSGLPVRRYDATALGAELGTGFSIVETLHEQHRTPAGAMQSFCYAVFRRGGS